MQRRSSLALGRNLLRVARTIAAPEEKVALGRLVVALETTTPRASVFGAVSQVFGVDESGAVEGHVYSVLSSTIAAAVRLALVPPLEGQAVLRRLLVAGHEDCGNEWSLFSPLLDVSAMRHELAEGRLFAS